LYATPPRLCFLESDVFSLSYLTSDSLIFDLCSFANSDSSPTPPHVRRLFCGLSDKASAFYSRRRSLCTQHLCTQHLCPRYLSILHPVSQEFSSWGFLDVVLRYDCCICHFAAISHIFNVFFDTLDVPDAVYWIFVMCSWMRPRAVAAHILLILGDVFLDAASSCSRSYSVDIG
jgi:hypothetical protein